MSQDKYTLNHFISEPITIHFVKPPSHTKKPHCPDRFNWRGDEWIITTCLAEWVDYTRRGRMAKNMQPQHGRVASLRGSWGVGRFYFDVRSTKAGSRTQASRLFRLYYDRAPQDASDRTGHWVLLAELAQVED
jgi:hypothetical protein